MQNTLINIHMCNMYNNCNAHYYFNSNNMNYAIPSKYIVFRGGGLN